MLASFDGLALRQLTTRRLRTALTSFGIVLGVGMVFAVLVLSGTIRHTFDDVIRSAWGGTDLVAMGETGGTMSQSALPRIQETDGVQRAVGMVGGQFVRLDSHGEAIRGLKGQMWVAGMDPTGPQPYDFRYVAGRKYRAGSDLVVEREWASDHRVRVGQWLTVATPTGRARLHVVGIFKFRGNVTFGGAGFAGMALPAARRIMNVPSGWQQISITALDPNSVGALRAELGRELGRGISVKTPNQYGDQIAEQLKGLDVVLYFFSGIALFVGGFLILNSFNMTVLQRLRELGTLRTLGASRRMVVRSVLLEALATGVAGTLLGLAVGLGMTYGLIQLMKGFGIPIGAMQVGASAVITSIVLGIVVTLLGALWPARRAGRIPPIQAVLGTGAVATRRPFWTIGLGVALFLPGAILGGGFWLGGGDSSGSTAHNMLGIALTMSMFAGMALAAPALILPIARTLAAGLRRLVPTSGRLAADSIARNPARTAATAVALTIGLSVIVVNSGISSSFQGAINSQIDHNFARDLTVRPVGQGPEQGGAQTIPPAFQRDLAHVPGVALSTGVEQAFVRLPHIPRSQPALGMGVDPAAFGRVDTSPVRGATRAEALRAVAAGAVIVSRSYAKDAGLRPGDTIVLRGGGGVRRARIVAELDSIASFAGPVVQMSSATMRQLYGVMAPAEMAVKLRPGADPAGVRRAVDRLIARRYPSLEVLSSADVKRAIRADFDKQFNMFNAIIAIAVLVSLMGVVNTLAMAVAERTREIGVLRALGASRWLVRRTMLDESLLITLSGAFAGVVTGALIGWAWISSVSDVGGGLSFRFPWQTAVGVAVVAIVLGAVASILPARRAARLNVIDALNYE
jgi:putative ABC transport system permease protein